MILCQRVAALQQSLFTLLELAFPGTTVDAELITTVGQLPIIRCCARYSTIPVGTLFPFLGI